MDKLPPEILERIFSNMPLRDLLMTESLVCKKWHDIIARSKFLPWRKSYHQYKIMTNLGKEEVIEEVINKKKAKEIETKSPKPSKSPPGDCVAAMMGGPSRKKRKVEEDAQEELKIFEKLEQFLVATYKDGKFENNQINFDRHLHQPRKFRDGTLQKKDERKWRLETDLPFLVKFVVEEFETQSKSGLFQTVRRHPKFAMAQDLLEERLPEFLPHVELASIVIICSLAEDAFDILEIFREMTKTANSCPSYLLSEVIYCVATALLHFQRRHGLPTNVHYRVFHGISFFENDFLGAGELENVHEKGKGKKKFQLTAEQSRIGKKIEYSISLKNIISRLIIW